ncbi:MAG TPA: glycosyltransferase family 39 protein [Candidatus Limnocylindrales bacterium]
MRIPIALVALALVVRAAVFGLHPDAAYPDSYYYVDVARALQSGHGFNIDFIWSFVDVGGRIPANPILPIPSNAHWMPLAAVIQLPTIWLLGPTPLASALPFLLIGSLAAPLTWLLAREIGCSSRIGLAAGIAVAVPAAATIYMSQPDNMSLYQPLGTAALWLTARALKGSHRSYLLAGVAVGLATLARNDGVLLGAAVGLAFVWDRWRTFRSKGSRLPAIPWRYAFACFGIFVLIMAPWYARQLAVFGSISPSSSSGRILLIQTYDQMNSVTSDTSLSGFLSQGVGPLLQSRLLGLISAIQIYFVIAIPIVLAPFVVIGAWSRRRAVEFGPFFTYAAILFAASGLLFAVHVPYGTFLHSAVALVPLTFILAFEGAVLASTWVVRHRPSWTPEGAARLFLIASVGSVLVNAGAFTALALPSWNADRDNRIAAGRALDLAKAPETDCLLSADPAGFKYFTGRGGVVTPNDSLEVIHEVAIDYDIRWLVIERAHIVAPLAPVIESKVRPAWIGAPIFSVAYHGKATGDAAVDAAPALAIYPICTTESDTRCGTADGAPADPTAGVVP